MVRHHQEAIALYSLAATRATDEKVKAMAARQRVERQRELAELKHFMTTVAEDMPLEDWTRVKKTPVDPLRKVTNAEFNRLFLTTVIAHHEDALTITRTARLRMPAVQQFAGRLTKTLTAELEELKTLR